MFGGGSSLQLFKLFGFRVGVHYSWFAILFLWILLAMGIYLPIRTVLRAVRLYRNPAA